MKIDEMLNRQTRGMSLNKALFELSNGLMDKLPLDAKDIMCYLLQQQVKKESNSIKPTIHNPFKLASLFIAVNEERPFLNYVYADGNYLIGSNGHVLIKIKHACEPGYYNALGLMVHPNNYATFPNLERAFMRGRLNDVAVKLSDGELIAKTEKMFYLRYGKFATFDQKYINLLKKIGVSHCMVTSVKKDIALWFCGDNFEGVVMRYKTDEELKR